LTPKIISVPPKPGAMDGPRGFAKALAQLLVEDIEGILK
jgi:hypothetical protein